MKKIHVFTHHDFDGVVSYMTLCWCLGLKTIPYTTVYNALNFREDFTKWLLKNNTEDYDKIFILDLDVSANKDLIDKDNIVIIDHHLSQGNDSDYKNAKAYIKTDAKAACEVIYKTFKNIRDPKLTDQQKKLIIYASDYDSWTLQFPESLKLNIVFNQTQNSFESFINQFNTGYHGLTLPQENIIKLYNQDLNTLKTSVSVYTGKFKIQGKERTVYATFADKYINELGDMLIKDYNADIGIVVNVKKNKVSLRKTPKDNELDLSILAKKLLNGGGHKYAAGGEITQDFMNFTKMLTQIK